MCNFYLKNVHRTSWTRPNTLRTTTSPSTRTQSFSTKRQENTSFPPKKPTRILLNFRILLFQAGYFAKALDLAIATNQHGALLSISKKIENTTDPILATRYTFLNANSVRIEVIRFSGYSGPPASSSRTSSTRRRWSSS